ncbi:hypothetical protein JXA48_05110 [Candidatus Woesearchaeota archaeon]|nr:hypothetical protein [Candidatus Woesearchaeota archaeon]
MMEIKNVKVYDLEESIKASSYPMSIGNTPEEVSFSDLMDCDFKRASKLGSVRSGSGHDNFLKGIVVNFDISAPQYWWPQFQRYHFADIVSSQSKMHRLTKMDLDAQYNEWVLPEAKLIVKDLISEYDQNPSKDNFQRLVSNVPMGLNLSARITTNYLQLKGIHSQRRSHKLNEWQYFCDWVETLPYFTDFVKAVGGK